MITTGKFSLDQPSGETYKIVDNTNMTDAYWLRVFASAAMQGILATVDNNFEKYAVKGAPEALAASATRYAKALLAEVKKCEAEND